MSEQMELPLPKTTPPRGEPLLWLSDSRGIYIPRDFAASFSDRARSVANVSDEDWDILDAGPDHEHYWDAWDEVISHAIVTDDLGREFFVSQEGDCWLIPCGMQWSDDREFWVWNDDDMDNDAEGEPDPDRLREDRDERRALNQEDGA